MVQDTKELNRSAVLTELLRHRPSTRKRVSTATGISQPTVTRAVDELIGDGILFEGEEVIAESRGRRARSIDLISDRAYVVGVDLGASNTRLLVTDLVATPIRAATLSTPTELGSIDLAHWLAGEIKAVSANHWDRVAQVALGMPGAVSQDDFTVSNADNLRQVEDALFLGALRDELGKPLQIDNDANYALLGELRFGAAKSALNAAMLTLGAGLGAGLAVDGRLLQGRRGLVGEFGQLPMLLVGDRLGQLVTGPGIMRRAREANLPLTDPSGLFAHDASPLLRAMRAQFDQALLIVVMAIVAACEPQVIVLGGGISASIGNDLSQYEEFVRTTLRYSPKLVPPKLGDFSGATGAAVSGLQAEYLDIGVNRHALASLPNSDALSAESLRRAVS